MISPVDSAVDCSTPFVSALDKLDALCWTLKMKTRTPTSMSNGMVNDGHAEVTTDQMDKVATTKNTPIIVHDPLGCFPSACDRQHCWHTNTFLLKKVR